MIALGTFEDLVDLVSDKAKVVFVAEAADDKIFVVSWIRRATEDFEEESNHLFLMSARH